MLQLNPGHCPDEARGKRVRVILRNGVDSARQSPQGWPADGREGCNWSLALGDWSIKRWELV